jgi:hypothetical protein
MRVQDPPKYAEVLLGIARPREHWTAEKIKHMFGKTFSSNLCRSGSTSLIKRLSSIAPANCNFRTTCTVSMLARLRRSGANDAAATRRPSAGASRCR